jgi:hypothetical protein
VAFALQGERAVVNQVEEWELKGALFDENKKGRYIENISRKDLGLGYSGKHSGVS